jgi:radical SAM superfamily enzyme YgiQ (UPF0313 family)
MKILFVQTNTYPMLYPLPIGPALVARRLQSDGHDVRFVDLMGERDPVATARAAANEFRADLACFSVRNRDNQSPGKYLDPMPGIRAVFDAVREAGPVPTLLGGTAFTTFPERVLTALGGDYGIAGDDLEPISRFVTSVAAGTPDLATPGLVYRQADGCVVENPFRIVGYRDITFDHHAFVDRRRYRKSLWQAAIVTRTGCPEHCAYCDTFRTFGRDFVLRDPAVIAEEMLALKRAGTARTVWFVDAGFNRPLDHAKEVLREIIRRGAQLRIYALVDPGPTDREFFELYRRAGGLMVMLFADSLSDGVLAALGRSFTSAEVMRDARMLREAGISFMFMPTFGSPGETRETVRETLSRMPALGAIYSMCNIGWRIQPRTPLRERAIREGLIAADDDCWDARFYISPETPKEWLEQQLRAFRWRNMICNLRIFPFMLGASFDRPWRRGPEAA